MEKSLLERLLCGDLISSYILSYLDLNSIRCFGLCSVTCHFMTTQDLLWKILFDRFWNVFLSPVRDSKTNSTANNGFWKQCFRNAYTHDHLLWVSHWNCIFPDADEASLQPGRCCIPHDSLLGSFPRDEMSIRSTNPHRMCPSCRYHPCFHGTIPPVQNALQNEINYQNQPFNRGEDPVSVSRQRLLHEASENTTATCAKLLYFSTLYSVAKWCRAIYQQIHLNGEDMINRLVILPKVEPEKLQQRARQAFASASHCHSQRTDQYLSNGLYFLSDLLFFQIQRQGLETTQLNSELHKDVYGESTTPATNQRRALSVSAFGPAAELATHSCHVVKLTNPLMNRPILFKIYIQRCAAIVDHQCFTAYPAEGLIQPGNYIYVYFCVRSSGALLSCLAESINYHPDTSNFTEVSNTSKFRTIPPIDDQGTQYQLPSKPFVIRYLVAPPNPFIPKGYDPRRTNCSISEHLWETALPQSIRTIHLKAHVHTHFSFESFQFDTLFPFDIHSLLETKTPPLSVPVQLTKFSPRLAEAIGCRPAPLCYTATSLGAHRQNLRLKEINAAVDLEVIPAGLSHKGDNYKTEDRCSVCSRKWGEYCERLGRLFVLRRLALHGIALIQRQRLRMLEQNAHALVQLAESELLQNEDSLMSGLLPVQNCVYNRLRRMYNCLNIMFSDLTNCCLEYSCVANCDERLPLSLLLTMEHARIKLRNVLEASVKKKKRNLCPLAGIMMRWIHKLFKPNWQKRRRNVSSKVTLARANKTCREKLCDLSSQQKNSLFYLQRLMSTIQISFSMLFYPLKVFSHGVYDRVFSPSLVTGVEQGPFFFKRPSFSRTMNPLGTSSLESDPDPEAIECILSSLKRSKVCCNNQDQATSHVSPQEMSTRSPRRNHRANNNVENFIANRQLRRRGINIMVVVCELLGWDLNERDAPIVDTKILIALQFLSNSLAFFPLLISLLARWSLWITPNPYDYYLYGEALGGTGKKLRYLDCNQCFYGALFIIILWVFVECKSPFSYLKKNQRSKFSRSRCNNARYDYFEETFLDLENASYWKAAFSVMIMLFSFCSVTPHYFLNFLSIFLCAVATGLSLSAETLEFGREALSVRPVTALSLTKVELKFRHLCIFALLGKWPVDIAKQEMQKLLSSLLVHLFLRRPTTVGQVIGSSGGVNFLAEFIVTSTSFLLGGVATISSSAVESWLVFASLSTAAFWGFLFARIGLLDGMKIHTRTPSSSFLLRSSLVVVTVVWISYMLLDDWMAPCTVMLKRRHLTSDPIGFLHK